MTPKTKYRARHGLRGSVLVEMAIVLPVLVMLTFAIIQYGIVLNATNTLTEITREAARYAAVHPNQASVQTYVQTTVCPGTSIPWSDIGSSNVTVSFPSNSAAMGNPVMVTIQYDLTKKIVLAPLVPGASGLKKTISRSATMTIEY